MPSRFQEKRPNVYGSNPSVGCAVRCPTRAIPCRVEARYDLMSETYQYNVIVKRADFDQGEEADDE